MQWTLSVNTAAKNTINKLKARKPSPTHIGIAVWLMSSCNVHHESTVSLDGYHGTVALCIFPLFTIVLGNCNLAMPVQVSPIRRCHLMATMNQLNLDTKGPGIIALQSYLHLQSCRVTATSISFDRISLTNLPLLLPSISITYLPLQCKLSLT